ncbi:MAG: group 1 truncated hemoglobin [Gammaproteobacteria bacterium]|nr:group 1 truncated hemoglobin [Gammaproteobacteria bacterium]NIN61049.1 group 1 truncated hemoglobin [Gammaproteobacteria bacterium]NIO62672.1 group 1 truncated hemoglobin [Gammaproteobacteria bacterium]NIP49411.1 group 1 truncated hemoglobin [Gammaproteobacteria bacterium]NIQ10635.1 group 1 truncated hemoglobin [Gammaproteobacteria bacterium]
MMLISSAMIASLSLVSTSAIAAEEKSLFERLGGTYAIAQTVDHLVNKLYVNNGLNANPIIKAIHDDKSTMPGFKVMLTNWVVARTGGPKIYQPDMFGRGVGMKESHAHLNISNREFDIIMNECKNTFYTFNVPEKELGELMADLESFRNEIVTFPHKE